MKRWSPGQFRSRSVRRPPRGADPGEAPASGGALLPELRPLDDGIPVLAPLSRMFPSIGLPVSFRRRPRRAGAGGAALVLTAAALSAGAVWWRTSPGDPVADAPPAPVAALPDRPPAVSVQDSSLTPAELAAAVERWNRAESELDRKRAAEIRARREALEAREELNRRRVQGPRELAMEFEELVKREVESGDVAAALSTANAMGGNATLEGSYLLACIYEKTGDTEAMLRSLDAAIRIDRDFARPRRMRARARQRDEDYAGAVEDLNVVLVAEPADLESRRLRGFCLLLGGHPESAAEDLRFVTAVDGSRLEDWLRLAEARDDAGDTGAAIRTLEEALNRWPERCPERAALVRALQKLSR